MRSKYFLLGLGIGFLIAGGLVTFFSNDPSFSKWLLPFGATFFGLAFRPKL